MAAFRALLRQELLTNKGRRALVCDERIYVRNSVYFRVSTQEWIEYFYCANNCTGCLGRVYRVTPSDGTVPYVVRSTDPRSSKHDLLCRRSATRVLLRKARQEFNQRVEFSSSIEGSRKTIRESYNDVCGLLLRNSGRCRSLPL